MNKISKTTDSHSERGAGVGKQGHVASSLDGLSNPSLLSSRGVEALAGVNLPVGSHHSAKVLDRLVVDVLFSVGTGLEGDRGGCLKLAHK